MSGNIKPYTTLKKWLCFLLLGIMGWQQWDTFAKYQDKFASPVQYAKDTYGNDDVSQYETRIAEVKKMFPGEGHLTYVSEHLVPNAGTRELHFALSQYNLAPNLLYRNNLTPDSIEYDSGASPITFSSLVCDTVIYNLFGSINIDPNNDYYLNNGWHIVKDFNDGIIVLAR
jgi:hypothetical protein